jgi:hypothetical protein
MTGRGMELEVELESEPDAMEVGGDEEKREAGKRPGGGDGGGEGGVGIGFGALKVSILRERFLF